MDKDNYNLPNLDSFIDKELDKLFNNKSIEPAAPPEIDLYMDQLLTFLNSHLASGNVHDEEKSLTKTMINNYTKKKLLPAPEKKKYSKDHIYILTIIYYMKNILTIEEIKSLVSPLTEYFYKTDSSLELKDIYGHLYELEMSRKDFLAKDLLNKVSIAKTTFDDLKDSKQKDYLQTLSLILLLSFEIYAKKNLIEDLIHELNPNIEANDLKKKKDKK